ncbi:helix-turn-helix domain-containing protein [Neomicrococcus lactis]|uniref:helix-turn-helix domain-containing protein n=1 Tax=Neomicrococcus lactis TaxID=732241 RepID=UPI0022FFD79F|nr:helix-turn-helix domain-containing protein [Neomicrococcus lactis]
MALLNAFGEDALIGVGVSELARRADLSKSTAFRLLSLLQNNGAVERAGYRSGRPRRCPFPSGDGCGRPRTHCGL